MTTSDNTTQIPLTLGYVATVDYIDSDLALVKWTSKVTKGRCYARRGLNFANGKRNTLWIHRVIFSRILNRPLLKTELVDHIDNNPLNNRRDNLRLASPLSNQMNSKRPKSNTSGFKGVSWDKRKNKWAASIRVNGRTIQLGKFETALEAHMIYCKAAIKHFGEFARFN